MRKLCNTNFQNASRYPSLLREYLKVTNIRVLIVVESLNITNYIRILEMFDLLLVAYRLLKNDESLV